MKENSRTLEKTLVHLIRGPQVVPVLGREVVEGEQRVPVLGQALGGAGIFRPVLLDEDVNRGLGRCPGRGAVDLAQVRLHGPLHGFRHLVEHVAGLVEPAALVPGARIDLVQRFPEAECAVADRDLRRDGKTAPLHLDQQFAPALGALPDTHLEADELLATLRGRADQDEHALGVVFHPGLEVDAVCPDINIAPGREVAGLPADVLGLPLGRETRDHRGREVRGAAAEQGCEGVLEVTGRDPAQVENGQERVETPGPPCPFRQDGGREANPLGCARRASVPDLHPRHWYRTDPGLDLTLRAAAVSHKTGSPVRKPEILHAGQKGLGLKLHRLREKPSGASPQHIRQGIMDLVGLTKSDDLAIRVHGVSLSLRGPGRLDTRLDTSPISFRHHPVSSIARAFLQSFIMLCTGHGSRHCWPGARSIQRDE